MIGLLVQDNLEVSLVPFSLLIFSVLCQIQTSKIMVYTSFLYLLKLLSLFNTLRKF